ncbi:hypothetical protein BJX96DRAFT_154680 [Aspergillus floccosus]
MTSPHIPYSKCRLRCRYPLRNLRHFPRAHYARETCGLTSHATSGGHDLQVTSHHDTPKCAWKAYSPTKWSPSDHKTGCVS